MEIVYREEELLRYMRDAVQASDEAPVLLDSFLDAAIEVDIDALVMVSKSYRRDHAAY